MRALNEGFLLSPLNRAQIILLIALSAIFSTSRAHESDYGTTGLIKMPNGRMAKDGSLSATIALDEVVNFYNLSFQALPRVQGTFRYAIFNPKPLRGSSDDLKDRSYGIKVGLLNESRFVPALAIGGRDVLGTGALQGEYLAASKYVGGLDITIGLGWGRLGERSAFSNPLGWIDSRFDERLSQRRSGGRRGGESRGRSFFRGDAALFGGLWYRIPGVPLSAIIEYESDLYLREARKGSLDHPDPWNFGLIWEPLEGTAIRVSWLRGDTLGFTLSSKLDTKKLPTRKYSTRLEATEDGPTQLPDGYDPSSWYDRMLFQSENSGLYLKEGKLKKGESKASIVVENTSYNLAADAVHQIASLSEVLMPSGVKGVDILLEEEGMVGPTINYRLQREKIRGKVEHYDTTQEPIQILAPRKLRSPTNKTDYGYPNLGFGIDLAAKVQLMDPDDPARKQLYAKLTGRLQLTDHFNVWMRYEQDLYNDFSAARPPTSRLTNVRTFVDRYLVEGESGVEQLYGEYRNSLNGSIHTRFYAGILESMYGGLGGEILYSPYDKRWALGLSVSTVRQRDFDRGFGFRDYETTTGHVSAYYASPFYNVDIGLHVGRYLAEDRGYTLEARRTFDSGFSIGGFFTRTNVSARDFGEGSFDKGLFFRIPFDGFLPGNTRSAFSTIIRPLERDGGRRLEDFGSTLWFNRRSIRYDALDRNMDRASP